MSQEYTIDGVSHKVNNWSSQYGDFTTYNIKLPGSDESVQLNKKSDSPAPKVGDVIFGDITETEFGKKFKSAKKPFSGGASKPAYKDHSKDITLGMVWKTVAGIRGLPENDEDFAKFFEIVDQHLTELVLMSEKLNEPLVKKTETKKATEPLPEPPEDEWDSE